MRSFVNVFMIDPDEQKPYARPVTAYLEYDISPSDLTQEQRSENNGYYNDHQRHKYDEGIQTVQYPDWRQEKFHVTK